MKLKFKKQKFQIDAVNSAVDLFKGQQAAVSTFSVAKLDIIDYAKDELLGFGNRLTITREQIAENLKGVQQRNVLPLTELEELRFNIEMETGYGQDICIHKDDIRAQQAIWF